MNTRGERFKLAGINWYGAAEGLHVVGGLNVAPLAEIAGTVEAMGFTVVRLPFSNEMLRRAAVPAGAIDFARNPTLRGRSPLEVLDAVVDALGAARVAVVLSNHATVGGADSPVNGLWFHEGSAAYTEEAWRGDWVTLAARYRAKPWVVGCDLRNDVRPPVALRKASWPVWGSGDAPAAKHLYDWSRAAGACARALVAAGHEGLVVVERVGWPQEGLAAILRPYPPWDPSAVGQTRPGAAAHAEDSAARGAGVDRASNLHWAGVPRDRIVLGVHCFSFRSTTAQTRVLTFGFAGTLPTSLTCCRHRVCPVCSVDAAAGPGCGAPRRSRAARCGRRCGRRTG